MKIEKGSKYESKAAMDMTGKNAKLLANPADILKQEELKKMDAKQQAEINAYNLDLENAPDDRRFHNKHFVGNTIIVKLEKINWLVPSQVVDGFTTINPFHFITAVTPDFPNGKTIMNPFPYQFRGVVVAIGDEVTKYRAEKELVQLEVGDIVELNWFEVKPMRYYPEKHRIDQVTLDNPYAPNFEGFVKVPAQFVEAIVKEADFELVYGSTRAKMYEVANGEDTITYQDYDAPTQEEDVIVADK